jgi:hypothetical protein
MSDERDSDIGEFDETNGLAPGLDGDSDGTNEDVDQKEHGERYRVRVRAVGARSGRGASTNLR